MKTSFRYIILFIILALVGCKNRQASADPNIIYICSMDPQVKETKPGNCPICKMPLTPVSLEESAAPGELKLSDQQILLGNISVDTVTEHPLGKELSLTGILAENQDAVTTISSRVAGRIDNLFVKTIGQKISKGQQLYSIYSEELLLALSELKLAQEKLKTPGADSSSLERIIRGTKNKLYLYDLTDSQIADLVAAKELPQRIPIYSSVSGVISAVDITEGSYVTAGTQMFHISDYSSVWAQAEIFSEDISKIRTGSSVLISIPSLNIVDLNGIISLINPSLDQNSKLNLVRVVLNNKDGLLKPGMQADFSIVYDSYSAIAVPTNSILLDEDGATIWIQTGPNTYKSRMVETGTESNGFTEIKKGISKGERVVVTGAYLLNSEFIFQKGSNPMAGHDMSTM